MVETCGFPAKNGQIITDDSADLWSGTFVLEYQQYMVIDFHDEKNLCLGSAALLGPALLISDKFPRSLMQTSIWKSSITAKKLAV